MAIQEAPNGNPLKAATLSNLSTALRLRFERAGGPADLNEAITAGERALAMVVPGARSGPRCVQRRARIRARFAATGNLSDIGYAIKLGAAGVAAAGPGDYKAAVFLSNVGGALWDRLRHTGDPADRAAAIGWLLRSAHRRRSGD